MKPKYNEKVKLLYLDTDSFIFHVKTEDVYKDNAKDVERNLILQIMRQKHCFKKKKAKNHWFNER